MPGNLLQARTALAGHPRLTRHLGLHTWTSRVWAQRGDGWQCGRGRRAHTHFCCYRVAACHFPCGLVPVTSRVSLSPAPLCAWGQRSACLLSGQLSQGATRAGRPASARTSRSLVFNVCRCVLMRADGGPLSFHGDAVLECGSILSPALLRLASPGAPKVANSLFGSRHFDSGPGILFRLRSPSPPSPGTTVLWLPSGVRVVHGLLACLRSALVLGGSCAFWPRAVCPARPLKRPRRAALRLFLLDAARLSVLLKPSVNFSHT